MATEETVTASFAANANHLSSAIYVKKYVYGSFQVRWESINAFNARLILQGSNDGTNWNDLGGVSGGIILDNTPDTQIWEFTKFTTEFIRVRYQANSVTAGTVYWELEGKGP